MQNPNKGEQTQEGVTPNKYQLNKHQFDSETYDSSKKDINASEINPFEKMIKKSIDFFPKKMTIEKIDNTLDVHRKYTVENQLIIKDFVPHLKPMEIHVVPSKLRLNKKGFKDLKINKNKILLNSNKYYISCPNSENDYEDDSDNNDKYESSKENQSSLNEIKNDKIKNNIFNFNIEYEKDINIKETRQNLVKTKNKNIPKVYSKNNFDIKGKYDKELNLGISSDSDDLYDIDEIDNYSLLEYDNKDENKEKNNKRNRTNSFTILEMLQKKFELNED